MPQNTIAKSVILFFLTSHNAFAGDFSLEFFLQKVKKQNLEVQIEKTKENVFHEKKGIRLPPPSFTFIHGKETPGTKADGFEIAQDIPFPTKINANYQKREMDFKAQSELKMAVEGRVLAQAKLSYIKAWITQEKIKLLYQNKKILEEHIELTKSAVRSDSFLKVHQLKAESDLDLLINEIDSTKQKLKENEYKLLEIINEDVSDLSMVFEEPALSPLPNNEKKMEIPELQSLEWSLKSMKESEAETRASWFSDFKIKYKTMSASSMSNRYSEIMVGVTLPFFYFWQTKREVSAARWESLQAEFNLEKKKREIENKISFLSERAISFKRQLLNLKINLIPRAEKRVKIVHNLAPRDMEIIKDHRETMEALPLLKMTMLELREKFEEAVLEIESLTKK